MEISQFADDIAICTKDKDMDEAIRKLKQKLQKLEIWGEEQNFIFSIEKSVIVPFTRKPKLIQSEEIIIDKQKYLGVTFDKNLTWKKHIEEIYSRANKRAGILKWIINKYRMKSKIIINIIRSLKKQKTAMKPDSK